MVVTLTRLMITILLYTSLVLATTVNGRFVVIDKTNTKLSILLQLNTSTGNDDLGGATIVVGFDTSLINITNSPKRNIDYYFHNFNGGNYSLGTLTKPSSGMVWINIDLPPNKVNNGIVVSQNPEWSDVITINFDLINYTDSIGILWPTSSTFWGIFDGNNVDLWDTGQFDNFIGKINFDITPPSLLDAVLLDPVTLELTFSEPLDSASALSISNYTISNNINVQNALLSSYKDIVTLITDNHINGVTYTITADSIFDVAGNLINSQNNYAEYICLTDSTAPSMTEVLVQNNRTITVNFSERIDYNSASNKNNYSISNNIDINSVQVLPDSSGTMIKTSKQKDDTDYILTVTNIKDRAGNNINPNPSSKSYKTPKKGKGNPRQNDIMLAKSNSWFQYYTPEKTIDGRGMTFPDSRWQSGEALPVDIIFDLNENHSFDSLRISFYKWEAGKKFLYSVYTSIDSINWIAAIEEIWSENLEWTEIEIDSVETRYMKLSLLESNQGPFASIWEVEMYGTDIINLATEITKLPESFELYQNYPNPFNPSTKIRYSVPQTSNVITKVFDILGNELETLINEEKTAGTYELTWNAMNLPSGVYFYQLKAGDFVETKKMVLLR